MNYRVIFYALGALWASFAQLKYSDLSKDEILNKAEEAGQRIVKVTLSYEGLKIADNANNRFAFIFQKGAEDYLKQRILMNKQNDKQIVKNISVKAEDNLKRFLLEQLRAAGGVLLTNELDTAAEAAGFGPVPWRTFSDMAADGLVQFTSAPTRCGGIIHKTRLLEVNE